MGQIQKVAIANRGEVAVRIIRSCQELGLQSVLLHSDVDRQSLAYRLADEVVCIGPAPVSESYLNIEANILAAKSVGADAIHPGFGFLSENADFAQTCEENGIIFIGPSAESIRLFGDKISAKKLVEKIAVPLIPGFLSNGSESLEELITAAKQVGFPVMVKAAAGGGGRGLKVIHKEAEAADMIQSAQREGKNSFGSDRVFLERYLAQSKHIEVQIFVDASGQVFHLYERECSVQRRHQKVIEESPSALLSDQLRQEICAAAVKIAEASNYRGAGTVEFLVEGNEFFFLEMNTRLQVEHPVTEMVLNIDLVKAQLMTARGEALLWEQSQLTPRGHAIECRLYAENAFKNGMPSTGRLLGFHWPQGPGRRFEVGFEATDEITAFYDPMIAKVVVWDEDRMRAIQKMRVTLRDTVVFGVHTNIPYLLEILHHPEFVEGNMNTRFIDIHFPQGLEADEPSSEETLILETLQRQVSESDTVSSSSLAKATPSPWHAEEFKV